jgi:nicotinamidase-related amidase
MRVTQEGPNRPNPQPLRLDSKTSAIVVLDLSVRCEDPQEVCSKLMQPLGGFLERARQAATPILYTISATGKGTPLGETAASLHRRASEPILYPDAFDKFMGGELKTELDKCKCRSLVIVGSATNFAILYTATTAARIYKYDVVIPLDGVNAKRQYEHEYAIHQMTILPASAHKQFRFSRLGMIQFL